LKIDYYIPEYVYISEKDEINVGWWDEENEKWETEEFMDVKYDKTNHIISFRAMRYAPFAYLQSRCTDFPYESWKLRCIDEKTALLDVTGKRLTLTFEVGPDYVTLIERKDPELEHLVDKKMHPGILLRELSRCGIHLLPEDRDFKLAGLEPKHRDAEERAIWDIVSCIGAYSFRSSKWNRNPKLKDNVVVKIRENLEYDREFFEDYEPDWRYIEWWANKCAFVDITDDDLDFEKPVKFLGENVTHALLSLTLENNASDEALSRCGIFPYIRFVQTLKKFLRLLRLLSFG
jgi:cancer susceptibility candidate protein 1